MSWVHILDWKPLAEIQGNTSYIRPKVVEPFHRPCTSRSYVHRAALFTEIVREAPKCEVHDITMKWND
jgi:hypothetical protein